MDSFGEASFSMTQSPVPPAPQPIKEEPKGPSEVESLRQQVQQLQKNYDHLQSSKDAKINSLTEQMSILNTTLQDQLTQRPTAQEVAQQQNIPSQGVDTFWDNYFTRQQNGEQPTNVAPPTQQVQEPSPQMEPKEIKKLVRDQVSQMVNQAQEKVVQDTQVQQNLVERYKADYGHLHHVTEQVQEIWNSIHHANPNLDPETRFNLAMQTAERILPRPQQSAPSPFGGGGQVSSYQAQPTMSTVGNTRMINGLPVRDMHEPMQATNDYILQRQAASKKMRQGPGVR